MDIHLFSGSGFAWRVLLACAIKNIDYKQVFLQPTQEALKSPAFLSLNARGKVPVMQEGKLVLAESMAIIAYLDRKIPEPKLLGATPEETGLIWQKILDFDLYNSAGWVNNIIAPIVRGQTDQAVDGIKHASDNAHTQITALEKDLFDKSWFFGGAVSAADIAIYPLLEALIRFTCKAEVEHLDLGFDLFAERYPQLDAWRSRVRELPRYQKTYPDFWRKLDG